MSNPGEVHAFWFGELVDGFADAAHARRWFTSDAARDAEIRDRFGHLLTAASRGELEGWLDSPPAALAFVIVCDQFSRQIHRGTAAAFATDPLALEAARRLVAGGHDQLLAFVERAFLSLPFQHSETRLDQHSAIGLLSALHDAVPGGQRRGIGGFVRSAREHRDVIVRFGRFPHRNVLLGRSSTAEERAYLDTASDFGQAPRQSG